MFIAVTGFGAVLATTVSTFRWFPAACALAYIGLCALEDWTKRRSLARLIETIKAELRSEIEESGYDLH